MNGHIGKTALFILLAGVIALGAGANALAQNVTGSPHDLTGANQSVTYTLTNTPRYVCEPCHTPHDANFAADTPLNNHELTTTDWTGGMYDSSTLDHTMDANLGGSDIMCMSCHDGTVAIDSFGGLANTGPTIDTAFVVGTVTAGAGDITDQHPVSFTYDETLDTGIQATTLPLFGAANDKMRCATCHNPHDNTVDATNGAFLRKTLDTLCQDCHIK